MAQSQSEADFFKTSGPGKIQLPDGRWVADWSTLGQQEKQRQTDIQRTQQQQQTIDQLAASADPFRDQRAQYQGQLKDLMTNPSGAMANNPFFKASGEAGQEAAMRRLRAMGMGTSGNAAFELQKQAQANMSGDYFKLADLLGGLSGAKANPSAGATAALNAMNMFDRQRQSDEDRRKTTMYNGVDITPRSSGNYSLGSYWGA